MKWRCSILVWLTAIGALALAACGGGLADRVTTGSGQVITEQRDFADFTAVDVRNVFEAEIVQSDSFNFSITADDNVLAHVIVSRDEATLRIRLEPRLYRHITMKIKIAMPDLRELDLRGASRVTVKGFESSRDLDIDISGASSLTGDIKAGGVTIEALGASRVTLAGSASTLTDSAWST